ncbi:MAG TPA: hypothetical protein DEA82_14105, partial [Flavobacteriaceae bacterium]|nr:hypothetical protein [Flavobacteriaceae bacterium]
MPQAAQKQDQEVEEKETDEIEVEVLETDEQEKPQAEAEVESKPEQSGDELEQYSEGVKKRISKLTAKMREAERREQAALQYAQSAKKELEENQKKNLSLDNSFVKEFENRVQLQDQLYRNTLKEAIDRGDVDGQVEAQRQLANVASQNDKLAMVKQQQEQRAQQPVPVQQPTQQQQQPAPPDPKATAWADKNDWFGTDEPMTLTAFSIHKTLVEGEGFDPHSDDYYAEVDRRIRQEFPHKFGGATRQSGPVVASASRGGQKKG